MSDGTNKIELNVVHQQNEHKSNASLIAFTLSLSLFYVWNLINFLLIFLTLNWFTKTIFLNSSELC